jgi:hypothetical protein
MSMSYWRAGRSSRGQLCAALVFAAMALAGCGSIAAPGSSAAADAAGSGTSGHAGPAQLALCANPAAADSVVISRFPPMVRIQPQQAQQAGQAKVTAAARAQALAKALCALPRMPKGITNCPMLLAGYYKLSFTAAGRPLPVVRIQVSGCQTVTGLGPVRSVSKSPGFWTVLAKQGNLFPAGRPVFLPGKPTEPGCAPPSTSGGGHTDCPGTDVPGQIGIPG